MLSDLAFALAERGHSVQVITSRLLYDDVTARLPPRQAINGVSIVRISTSRFGRGNLIGRALDYLTFYINITFALFQHARRGDVVVAKTDPPMLSVVASPIAWLRGARLVNWMQDVFPEVATALDVGKGPFVKHAFAIARNFRNRSLETAESNVVLGDRMAEHVQRNGVSSQRIRIINNWIDGDLIRPIESSQNRLREDWELKTGTFVVGYSGNLGRAHEFETMVGAVEQLERDNLSNPRAASEPTATATDQHQQLASEISEHDDIRWLFIGGGAQMDRLKQEVKHRRFSSVTFKPYQPRENLAASLSVPDVHLISLRPELEGLIVPSKYYGIAAAGRPAIFIGDPDGEIARVLKRSDTGFAVEPGDSEGLAEKILMLASDPQLRHAQGARARALFEGEFDFPIALAAWEDVLTKVSGQV